MSNDSKTMMQLLQEIDELKQLIIDCAAYEAMMLDGTDQPTAPNKWLMVPRDKTIHAPREMWHCDMCDEEKEATDEQTCLDCGRYMTPF